MAVIFWASVACIVYTYFGYPASLWLLSNVRSREVRKAGSSLPSVTLIVTVHNEQDRIEKKIANTLELDYPPHLLEVLFASDASTDRTDAVVESHRAEGMRLVRSPERRGKEHAQKLAIESARGEILVFSDVATMIEPCGIRNIVESFADPGIGCVSSEDRFINPDGSVSGEGAYVRYEMFLRSLESRVNSVVGLSGSFFAARREVCRTWPVNLPSDFNTLLNTVKAGLRGVSDPCTVGVYKNIKDEKGEFDRKVRTITRGISAFMASLELLNPLRYGLFSWQLFSHKLMRWCVPFFLVTAFFANLALAARAGLLYRMLLVSQCGLYALGMTDIAKLDKGLLKIPHYFLQVNRAIAVAWMKYLKGERFVTWSPSKR